MILTSTDCAMDGNVCGALGGLEELHYTIVQYSRLFHFYRNARNRRLRCRARNPGAPAPGQATWRRRWEYPDQGEVAKDNAQGPPRDGHEQDR